MLHPLWYHMPGPGPGLPFFSAKTASKAAQGIAFYVMSVPACVELKDLPFCRDI